METLCQNIHMPEEVTKQLLGIHRDPAFAPDLSKLTREETWKEGRRELRETLGDDPRGLRELCCMLRCALAAKENYARLGLSDNIYYDTMACFSRFVREHRESFGSYGFDRGFWTVRQISCRLFRIGQLEYELTTWQGEKAVSLHIPTDVTLQLPLLRQSWEEAKQIISTTFPEYADAPMFCESWLLSPALETLLPASSHILAFQRSFRQTGLHPEDREFILWVFRDPRLAMEDYPENTSLQRKLKAHLLRGGSFVSAEGILSEDPFLSA